MPQWSEQYGRLVKFSAVQWLRKRGGSCSGVCQSTRTTRPPAALNSPAHAADADMEAARAASTKTFIIGLRLIRWCATERIARHRADRQSTALAQSPRSALP